MKRIGKENVIYTFSPKHKPAERVAPGEYVVFETEDAFGGQVKRGGDFPGQARLVQGRRCYGTRLHRGS